MVQLVGIELRRASCRWDPAGIPVAWYPPDNALQSASAIKSGLIPFFNNISCLSSVYVRGEAYLAAGQGSAAAEFRKILDHGGMVWNCGTGALAHREIARASALQAKSSQGVDADAARVRAPASYKTSAPSGRTPIATSPF
jgi:hypothetical protein